MRQLYWAGLLGMEQCKVLIGGYEPKHTRDCLNFTKKNLGIIEGIFTGHLGKLGISMDTDCRFCVECDETSIHVLREHPAKLKDLEVGSVLKFLTVIGLLEIL